MDFNKSSNKYMKANPIAEAYMATYKVTHTEIINFWFKKFAANFYFAYIHFQSAQFHIHIYLKLFLKSVDNVLSS